MSTSIQKDCCVLLETLVSEHNNLYIKYSKLNLKPKYHFMQHYHTITEQLGPLVHLWSMRFEAKHRIFKIAANTTSNRRNI